MGVGHSGHGKLFSGVEFRVATGERLASENATSGVFFPQCVWRESLLPTLLSDQHPFHLPSPRLSGKS